MDETNEPEWAAILARYNVVDTELHLGGRIIHLSQVRDINALVDAMGPDDFGPDERMPYWAVLWNSARDLAEYLLRQRDLGPTIELGAGLGLCAIAAALSDAKIIATDYEADALTFIAHNAAQNGAHLETRLADWRELPREDDFAGRFQTVIASDVLYEARNVAPLADAIAHLLAPSGRAIVADPGRPHFPELCDLLTQRGYTVRALNLGTSRGVEARPAFTPTSG